MSSCTIPESAPADRPLGKEIDEVGNDRNRMIRVGDVVENLHDGRTGSGDGETNRPLHDEVAGVAWLQDGIDPNVVHRLHTMSNGDIDDAGHQGGG